MIALKSIELDLAFGCNLHCDGCTHYSNYPQKAGALPLETGREWLKAWRERVAPDSFSILGGEPALNPELPGFVEAVHEAWPDRQRVLVSNGLILDRHPGLWEALAKTGTRLEISIHSRDQAYQDKILPGLHAIEAARAEWGFELKVLDSIRFMKMYRGEGRDMLPFEDGDRRASWTFCTSRYCVVLHQNRLWKCPPIAHLGRVAAMFDLDREPRWAPYLAYEGYGLDASDEELEALATAEDEPICEMCPSTLRLVEKKVFLRD